MSTSSFFNTVGLSEQELDVVTTAVRAWCVVKHVSVDSECGRMATGLAIDILAVQPSLAADQLLSALMSSIPANDGSGIDHTGAGA